MSAFAARADRLASLGRERELDLLLVTNLVNVRYLCGFEGTNGLCLIAPGERVFVTDFRYVERASAEVRDYDVVEGRRDLLGNAAELAAERARDGLRLGFDDGHLTVRQHAQLRELLPSAVELVPAAGLVEDLRAVKDEQELATIRSAAEIADSIYHWLVEEHGLVGHTELAVSRALARRAEDSGAEEAAFPPIVAARDNGARPHAAPRDLPIGEDTLVVVDFGCRLDGYCSDCTRTFATGSPDEEAKETYELVRSAQAAAVAAVSEGAAFNAVDAAAREPIEAAGRGDQFKHPTGHGVGLEVHEQPRLAPDADGSLLGGNVVTVEPGIYVPGRFGVRIEDLVAVEPGDGAVLTSMPRELTTVG